MRRAGIAGRQSTASKHRRCWSWPCTTQKRGADHTKVGNTEACSSEAQHESLHRLRVDGQHCQRPCASRTQCLRARGCLTTPCRLKLRKLQGRHSTDHSARPGSYAARPCESPHESDSNGNRSHSSFTPFWNANHLPAEKAIATRLSLRTRRGGDTISEYVSELAHKHRASISKTSFPERTNRPTPAAPLPA